MYVSKGCVIHHTDLLTALLKAVFDSELCIEWKRQVYRLLKSLYCLNQSPGLWCELERFALMEFRFGKLDSLDCVFVKVNESLKFVLKEYIDDLIIKSPCQETVEKTKEFSVTSPS